MDVEHHAGAFPRNFLVGRWGSATRLCLAHRRLLRAPARLHHRWVVSICCPRLGVLGGRSGSIWVPAGAWRTLDFR